jgi:hypothetical protein
VPRPETSSAVGCHRVAGCEAGIAATGVAQREPTLLSGADQ